MDRTPLLPLPTRKNAWKKEEGRNNDSGMQNDKVLYQDDEEEDTPVYGISFFKTGSSERAIRDFSDVFLSEDEAAEFCADINENDLDEIHIDEIIQDAVNIVSFV